MAVQRRSQNLMARQVMGKDQFLQDHSTRHSALEDCRHKTTRTESHAGRPARPGPWPPKPQVKVRKHKITRARRISIDTGTARESNCPQQHLHRQLSSRRETTLF